ncbi:hypothetical protein KJ662_03295 [Patescibacteria group bacterium]|nr:hypothetical protein [Patescibacteria group bacterium]
MKKIRPKKVLFIKLGKGGGYEKECIEKTQTIRINYDEVDHKLALKGKWDSVLKSFLAMSEMKDFVASSHTNQVRQFYEEGNDTLWITFYANKLWWCFAKQEVTLLPDRSKTRQVVGQWSDKDINGNTLTADNISGKLLKTQGFRGTICSVPEQEYALAKINAEQLPEVAEVEKSLAVLKEKLALLIKNLQWKEFETLIDLIFRQAGWQRVGTTGKTQKTLDLDLLSPVTGERAIVQIKAESNLKEFKHYEKEFANLSNYDKFFYVVHTPKGDWRKQENETEINLWLIDKITELTINSGLVDWVIKKTS